MVSKESLHTEMNQALKEHERIRLSTLRLVLAEIKNAEIRKGDELDEGDIEAIIARELKKRRESIEMFERGGRRDLVEKEQAEAALLESYLPEQLAEEEVVNMIESAIEESGASSLRDVGKVMGALMPKIRGRADGAVVGKLVKERLGAG